MQYICLGDNETKEKSPLQKQKIKSVEIKYYQVYPQYSIDIDTFESSIKMFSKTPKPIAYEEKVLSLNMSINFIGLVQI